MQYLLINGQKIGVRQEIDIMGDSGVQKLVQLVSGAWCLGLTIPPTYVKSMNELEKFEGLPAALKKQVSDWLHKTEEEAKNPKPAPMVASDSRNPSPSEMMAKMMAPLSMEFQSQLLEVITKHLDQVRESQTQGPEINSIEGYGQDQEIPEYQEGQLKQDPGYYTEWKNPEGTAEDPPLDFDDPNVVKAYLKEKQSDLDQEAFLVEREGRGDLEEEISRLV